jgi:hypothetical protein
MNYCDGQGGADSSGFRKFLEYNDFEPTTGATNDNGGGSGDTIYEPTTEPVTVPTNDTYYEPTYGYYSYDPNNANKIYTDDFGMIYKQKYEDCPNYDRKNHKNPLLIVVFRKYPDYLSAIGSSLGFLSSKPLICFFVFFILSKLRIVWTVKEIEIKEACNEP